ncbi:Putative peptidoglycan binding domain-containing protein [Roseivivax lentus]|uniref:Putative peptidoglycan binding domain-containing protein n=1 Tax=Roseivivax lentus TaxID=633194 RepID=A0A1N7NSW9_9RHOB|nr:peptidoglycan-binding domain-containing protein [Roseivivax lentus]SIT01410.1 Putative peptidoglycan binding domain-containing protein [Roseivivax lentus]
MTWRTPLAALALTCLTAGPALADLRIVSMVVTAESNDPDADAVVRSLDRLDAEILRVVASTDAELRAIMRRFAREASEADAAIVFLDLPTVEFDGRAFVLPEGAVLARATDLFTEGVPVRAFARLTALAAQGGAVIVSAGVAGDDLPAGITRAISAPAPVPGTSEILLGPSENISGFLGAFDTATSRALRVDLASVLAAAAEHDPATLSARPAQPIVLKTPIIVGPPHGAAPEPVAAAPEPVDEPATEEELAFLEKSLSPAVKRDLQRALRGLGHYSGLIDGIIGAQSRLAITGFQADRDDETTGFLTPRQLRELLSRG